LLALKLPGSWEKNLRVLKDSDLTGLNTKAKTAEGAEAIARVLSHAPPAANRPIDAQDAESGEGPIDGPVIVDAERAHGRLLGAINHDQQRQGVSWIWLGVNLKPGEDNGDPAGLSC
jgi:hypothetical protein